MTELWTPVRKNLCLLGKSHKASRTACLEFTVTISAGHAYALANFAKDEHFFSSLVVISQYCLNEGRAARAMYVLSL